MNIGAVQFATKAGKLFDLTGDKSLASKSISSIDKSSMGVETRVDLAVEEVLKIVAGSRKAVDIMLVITDGLPTGGQAPGGLADKAFMKAKAAGVRVVFVP